MLPRLICARWRLPAWLSAFLPRRRTISSSNLRFQRAAGPAALTSSAQQRSGAGVTFTIRVSGALRKPTGEHPMVLEL